MPDYKSEVDRAALEIGFKLLLAHVSALVAEKGKAEIEVTRANMLQSARESVQGFNIRAEDPTLNISSLKRDIEEKIADLFTFAVAKT